jgi:hypothetical protein
MMTIGKILPMMICAFVCGQSSADETIGSTGAIDPALLPGASLLEEWHILKDEGGPTFSGSPAWRAHLEFLEKELHARGVRDLTRDSFSYLRWYALDEKDAVDRSLVIEGDVIPVASYWAYSGATGETGVTAPLVIYDKKAPPESMRDRIVVFDVSTVPESMLPMFKSGYEFANYTPEGPAVGIASDQWYQGNYVIRFGRFDERLRGSGAAGAVVIFDMSPERTAGLYTFPLLRPGIFGVPGLYLDREAGRVVREAALQGREATLTLSAREEITETYFLSGYLPGRNYGSEADEFILLVTHTDGPNLTQENGGLGILGVVDYFSKIPQHDRERTLMIMFDPQHYMPGRHVVDWYGEHPDTVSRIVASIGVEQLGQKEYAEQGDDYGLNGKPEPTLVFVQENDVLVAAAIDAVKALEVPRTEVRVPSRGGQGMWQGLGDIAIKQNIPGFAISSAMSGYWTTTPGLESFDKILCYKQVGMLTSLTQVLMGADLAAIAVPAVEASQNPAMSPGVDR